jgi:hypothetical protein
MTPTTGTAVIIIVAFFLPGFVTVLLQERTFRSAEEATPLDRLLLIVWYSAWTYVLLAILAVTCRVHKHDVVTVYNDYKNEPSELVWRGALVVLVPSLLIAEATRRWAGWSRREDVLKKLGINGRHTQPTGWDHFFRRGHDCMVRVTFADGRRVLGYYGPESFAAYSKDGGDLLLEKLYTPNDPDNQWFGAEVPGVSGLWVRAADAVCVEFYTPMNGGTAEEQEPDGGEEGGRPRGPQVEHQEPDASATTTEERQVESD